MASAADKPARRARPLSPHLQVYSFLINTVMSIVHRMTGAVLYVGSALIVWWLAAAAFGPEAYATVAAVFESIPGRIVLILYCWALMHHMFGGLRHFVWDTGHGFDLAMVDKLAWGTLFASVASTALIVLLAFSGVAG
ncbi:MAG: succinate dehydrogenase, cytochrome b556 subunit [Pseudomonadota bacterium]